MYALETEQLQNGRLKTIKIKDKENHRQGKSQARKITERPRLQSEPAAPSAFLGLWMGALRVLRRGAQKRKLSRKVLYFFGTSLRCARDFGVKE
jgi:hypothetical protein